MRYRSCDNSTATNAPMNCLWRTDLEHYDLRMVPLYLCVTLAVVAVASGAPPKAGDVTKVALNSGTFMPIVGLGTSKVTDEREMEQTLDAALEAGYRHIDTATVYRNEHLIGKVLKRWLSEGKLKREDLFITTKLPLYAMRAADVPYFLNESLTKLQLDYVDMYLIHMPFAVKREAYSDGRFDDNGTDPTTDHLAIWKAMVAEKEAGRAKALGVSNFNETQIERIIKNSPVPPANLQVELHLYHQQKPLVAFCKKNNIAVTAYAPIGSPNAKRNLPDLFSLPEVKAIAQKHNKTTAEVLLRHTVQRGIIVIPKSSNPKRISQNIDIFDFALDDNDVATLDALDKGIDGKLFNMKGFAGAENHPEYPWPALRNTPQKA
ncbi:1,5-anhydro-D-fructose reductase-like isoform X2 [Thrips palmi]|uniref:1,5-anhydro-D-fructose reductase-like isoform X2 n=1 Tax=Thrips palmi TaxID=161013 RepID=A0A6P8YE92_THRPL|nr:1,5-anhydro-D-fructose reductase-like isoform X2 [Thrips palmi]